MKSCQELALEGLVQVLAKRGSDRGPHGLSEAAGGGSGERKGGAQRGAGCGWLATEATHLLQKNPAARLQSR